MGTPVDSPVGLHDDGQGVGLKQEMDQLRVRIQQLEEDLEESRDTIKIWKDAFDVIVKLLP